MKTNYFGTLAAGLCSCKAACSRVVTVVFELTGSSVDVVILAAVSITGSASTPFPLFSVRSEKSVFVEFRFG